ncbi:MAG TPA: DUF1176 domain-containing protein [Allosphingosinicella sp.]|jgi:hypothetical protein
MLSFILLAAAAPQPAQLKTFSDWTVGCDNGRACHAVGLVPEDWREDALTMGVRRGPEADAAPIITFEVGDDRQATGLTADGKPLKARVVPYDGVARVPPDDNAEALEALRRAQQIVVIGQGGKALGTVSLKGVSAALLYMDEQQKRLGTVTALVRPGPKPAAAVPPPPPLPVVRSAPRPTGAAIALTKSRITALRRQAKCTLDEVGGPDSFETAAIDPAHTLLLLACGSGAYNVSYVPYVVRKGPKGPDLRLASFDRSERWWGEEGHPILTNAEWDPKRRLLTAFGKGRGLGDCGTGQDYAWDGTRFRLIQQIDMDECRGSVDYITTWRAEVRR